MIIVKPNFIFKYPNEAYCLFAFARNIVFDNMEVVDFTYDNMLFNFEPIKKFLNSNG